MKGAQTSPFITVESSESIWEQFGRAHRWEPAIVFPSSFLLQLGPSCRTNIFVQNRNFDYIEVRYTDGGFNVK